MPAKDYIWEKARAALQSLQADAGSEAIRLAQIDLQKALRGPPPSFDDPDAIEAWKELVALANVESRQMTSEQKALFAECIWRVYDYTSGLFE